MDAMEAAKVSDNDLSVAVPALPAPNAPKPPLVALPSHVDETTVRELRMLAYRKDITIPKRYRRKDDIYGFIQTELTKAVVAAETAPPPKSFVAPVPAPIPDDVPMSARFTVCRTVRLSLYGGMITKLKKGKVVRRGGYSSPNWARIRNVLGDDLQPLEV